MRTLDIIVPHYNEPWREGRKFFDLIEHQRGIDKNDIRVVIVQDGEDGKLDLDMLHSNYNYPLEMIVIPHGGVSKARNAGIDAANATWVTFCDFDDVFTSVYSLKGIIDLLKTPKADDYDFVFTPFVTENYMNGEYKEMVLTENAKETTWTHGKFFRLDFLRENGLRFNEELWFSEDSCLLAIMQSVIDPKRKAMIKVPAYPLYSWTCRKGSVTQDKSNCTKFAGQLLKRHEAVMKHLYDNGYMDNYRGMAVRAMWDMYYETALNDVPDETYREISEFYKRHKVDMEQVEKSHYDEIGRYSTKEHSFECKKKGSPKCSFEEWLEQIEKKVG